MKPKNWKQGDPISASRLNDGNAESLRSRRQVSLGTGSSLVNETLGNQSASAHEAGIRLVVATEDFTADVQETDIYAIFDPQYSGKCMMMRLNSSGAAPTGLYEQEVYSKQFRVWDPIALLAGTTSKECGDLFYTVYNKDSKRWEVLTAATTQTLRHAVTLSCSGDGWYIMELADALGSFPPGCNPGSESASASASASNTVDTCDICSIAGALATEANPAADTCTAPPDSGRGTSIGNGTLVYAFDKRTIPLKIGGMATIAWLGDVCTPAGSGSVSASSSDCGGATDSTRVYTVLTGEYEIVRIPYEYYECCPIEGIKRTICYSWIVEGALCPGTTDPCDTSASV